MRISAVIPTYRAKRFLPACLQALRAQLSADDEIILVDNASLDQAGAWAQQHARDVRVISLPENRGFAGGTNAGLRAASGDWLLLINDDALAEPGCIAALRRTLSQHPHAGAAAGTLVFSRHPAIAAAAGIAFRRDGIAIDLWPARPRSALPSQPTAMFGATGGLALLRRDMLDEIGLFPEDFFSYLEDADLAWRAQLCGWGCRSAPNAYARHVYSATGGQGSPLKQRLLARNRWRVLIRCMPSALLRECWASILAYDTLAIGYAALTRRWNTISGRLEALRDLPQLLAQRRSIQAQRTASLTELSRWLEPAPPPSADLRLQQQIAALTRAE